MATAVITIVNSQVLTLTGHLGYSGTCAGVWEYVDSLNNEYAIVGVSDKISIVDVTDPFNPVEKFSIPALPGQSSLWREVKTHRKYAYAVSEGGGGVICIDLSQLPASINYNHWYGDSTIAGQIDDAHTIAATDNYIYVFGASDIAPGGCIIASIADPMNPHFVGLYTENYIHDGYVRNDTLWAGEIYAGQFSVIDVTNKSNPTLITVESTPGQFCHNVWLSDDGSHAFTTDEVGGAPLGSFDVSNVNNIQMVAAYFTDSLPNEEVHNVRVLNDYLICPSYGSQLTIVDADHPDNLIEIARAPTDFNGSPPWLCWDASPYLPSGNIIATDIDGGLFVYQVNYQRACYLEGTTVDSLTGLPLNNVQVEILLANKQVTSDLTGVYKTGVADAGTFDVKFTKSGYKTKTYTGVTLVNGVTTNLVAELVSLSTGISENQPISMNVYPNPFNGSFTLKLNPDLLMPESFISISDVAGRSVYEMKITSGETSISLPEGLAAGIYTLFARGMKEELIPIKLTKN